MASQASYFAGIAKGRQQEATMRLPQIPRVTWDQHYEMLNDNYEMGEHASLLAPTGHGKTHLALNIAPLFEEMDWLTVDVKGDDPLLESFGHRVRKLPSRFVRRQIYDPHVKDGRRWRLIVPENVTEKAPWDKARKIVWSALSTARREHSWVLHLNEVAALSDVQKPGLNLGPVLRQLWRRGRPHVSLIAETQRPAWVPADMFDQATHFYIGGFRAMTEGDRRQIASLIGRPRLPTLEGLREHEFLYFNRRLPDLTQITQAPPRIALLDTSRDVRYSSSNEDRYR